MTEVDPYAELKRCALPEGMTLERRVPPAQFRRRHRHFIMLPMAWFERLDGASGQTYRLALVLIYLSWRKRGEPIALANGRLTEIDGVNRFSKWRALAELERRGLIRIERRPSRSPVITPLCLS
jgi:hypothetical protein